jgi:hypothetical protein
MKWAEVITVRSAAGASKVLASTVTELMKDAARRNGNEGIRSFHRERIDTDYCIVLFHEAKKARSGGSRLGLRLVAAFREFGMVHHTVWLEMEQNS